MNQCGKPTIILGIIGIVALLVAMSFSVIYFYTLPQPEQPPTTGIVIRVQYEPYLISHQPTGRYVFLYTVSRGGNWSDLQFTQESYNQAFQLHDIVQWNPNDGLVRLYKAGGQ